MKRGRSTLKQVQLGTLPPEKHLFSTSHPLFKMALAAVAFALIVALGTTGYILIEQFTLLEALYMTVITISTVGFTEVHPLSPQGRWFTIILILTNLSLLTFFVSYITQYFLDGHFQRFYKHYRMSHAIHHLRNHVVICGFGRNGQAAAHVLLKSKVPVVVIEVNSVDPETHPGINFMINGDATEDEILNEAGIGLAAALITTLPEDADNLFIVLTAREINPGLRIVSRASNDTSVRKLKTAGATEVIMPDKIGGMHMAALVTNPDVKEFIDYMSAQRSDVLISEVLVKRPISLSDLDCWKSTGATVIGMKNNENEYVLNPSSAVLLNRGDRLIVLGQNDQIDQVKKLLA